MLEKVNFMSDHEILPRSRRNAVAARKYQPLDRNGNIFITSRERLGVSAWIQFQSPSFMSVRSWMLSRAQKRDQSLELYFQQLALHLTTSTHQVTPRLGEPC